MRQGEINLKINIHRKKPINLLRILTGINSIIFLIIMLIVLATICTIIEPGIAVLLVPCVIWMIFMIKKNKDSKKTTMEYDRIKNLLPQKQASVFMLQGEYERWLESKERYL